MAEDVEEDNLASAMHLSLDEQASLVKVRNQIGEAHLTVTRPRWDQLVRQSIKVDLSISYWRGNKKNSAAMLGIHSTMLTPEIESFLDEYVNFGIVRLLPTADRNLLISIENRSHQILKEHSFITPFGRLVPKQEFIDWKFHTLALKKRFEEVAQRLVETRDVWVPKILDAHRNQAVLAASIRHKDGVASVLQKIRDLSDQEIAKAVDDHVAQIYSWIPSQAALAASFKFEWDLELIQQPMILAEGLNLEELLDRKAALEQQMEAIDIEGTREVQRLQLDALKANLDLEAEINAELMYAAATTRKEKIDDAINAVAVTIRSLLTTVCESVHEAIQRNGRVDKRALSSLRNLAAKVAALNFGDDEEIATIADRIQALSEQGETGHSDTADTDRAMDLLSDIAMIARVDMYALGKPPELLGSRGLAEITDDRMLEGARIRLSLPDRGLPEMEAEEEEDTMTVDFFGDGSVGQREL